MIRTTLLTTVLLYAAYCSAESLDIPVWTQSNIEYGKATTQAGFEQVLTMDIYGAETGPWEKKPLLILAHGGYFQFGDKLDFAEECEYMAKEGFIAVSISYRLIDIKNGFFNALNRIAAPVLERDPALRFHLKHWVRNRGRKNRMQESVRGKERGS